MRRRMPEALLITEVVSYGTPAILVLLMLLQVYELTQLKYISDKLNCLDRKKVNKEMCDERHGLSKGG